jgi:transaldolase
MKFFVDSADVKEIRDLADTGLVDGMLREGVALAAIAGNVVVKVPLTWDGLRACRALSQRGHKVNVTLCFSANQALLAAKAGAAFISPFIGRLDDAGHDGIELIREIRVIYDNYENLKTEILAASMRTPLGVKQAAIAGADIATMPPALIRSLAKHPMTDAGLAAFLADWAKTGMKIV